MALSNKFGWLVLITGNKSEMSVGYSTLYGDMAGGFGVLKDVYKTQVYELSHWRNANVPTGSAGQARRSPSRRSRARRARAALTRPTRTRSRHYDMLDAILRMSIGRTLARDRRAGFDEATVRRVAARMVDFAEYKRRQSPPGIKITTRAFGRTGGSRSRMGGGVTPRMPHSSPCTVSSALLLFRSCSSRRGRSCP